MKTSRLPITRCHANCIKCGFPSEFPMFESGAGGDFATYTGLVTSTIYRLDLAKIHYLGLSIDELLTPAIENECGVENLLCISEQIKCKICGTVFKAEHWAIDTEEIIDAVAL